MSAKNGDSSAMEELLHNFFFFILFTSKNQVGFFCFVAGQKDCSNHL